MNEIYGWRLKGRRGLYCLRDSLNFLFYIIFVVLHQYAFLHLCSSCCNRCVYLFFFFCLIVFTLPRASQGNMFSFQLTFSTTHLMSEGWNSKGTREKKKTDLMLVWTPQAIHPDSEKRGFRCDSFPLCTLLYPQTSPPKTPWRMSLVAVDKTHFLASACTSATWGTPPRTPRRKRRSTAYRAWE